MKVAVTGAAGFVGRHVVAALARRGIEPIAMMRPQTLQPVWLASHQLVRLDILEPPQNAFIALGRPDVLMHLAWGGLPNYQSSHHLEQELPAHGEFLRSLIDAGLATLLVTGTCFEYGMRSGALSECLEAQPTNGYASAKDALRRDLEASCSTRAFNLTWARLFYLYGDGQAAGSLLPQLQKAVAAGATHFDMSGGEQVRDYMPIEQAAEHLVSLALSQRSHGVVNVCSGQPITVRERVERWIASNGWSIRPNLGVYPYTSHEPMAFWGEAKKLHACLAEP